MTKQERKMVRRSVAITLGIICVILVAALGVVAYMGYSPTANNSVLNLQNQIHQLQGWLDGNNSQILDVQNEVASLNSTHNDYVASHHHTDSDYNSLVTQITNLQNQIDNLTAPKLITVHLLSDDGGLPFQSRKLHIIGSIVNVRMNPASNSGGTPLSNWTITPEWAS